MNVRKVESNPAPAAEKVPTKRTQTHEDLEREHNRREHDRHDHVHGREYDSSKPDETLEPWSDYDLAVMPRGV